MIFAAKNQHRNAREEQALRLQLAKRRDIERIHEQLALKAEFKEVWE